MSCEEIFNVAVESGEGGVVILRLSGSMTYSSNATCAEGTFEQLYKPFLHEGCLFLVDFSKLQYLDNDSKSNFVVLFSAATNLRGRVKFCGASARLYEKFRQSRLENIFEFYETEAAALASFD